MRYPEYQSDGSAAPAPPHSRGIEQAGCGWGALGPLPVSRTKACSARGAHRYAHATSCHIPALRIEAYLWCLTHTHTHTHSEVPMTHEQMIEAVEQLVDSASLAKVVDALSCMCSEKEEHILTNWQDRATARPWARAATALQRLAHKLDI